MFTLPKPEKSMAGLNAAFVNVGHEKDGFLHYHDLGPRFPSMLKFLKQISTGKQKDYFLKNFRFEADISKDGNIESVVKSPTKRFGAGGQRAHFYQRPKIEFRNFTGWTFLW